MKSEDFSKEKFSLSIIVNENISNCFNSFVTAKGLESWFIGDAVFENDRGTKDKSEHLESGDNYNWVWQKDFSIKGSVIKYIKNKEVAFTFGQNFTFEVKFSEIGKRTMVNFIQHNHKPTSGNEFAFINCCVCWNFFLTNLKSVLENKSDLRETIVFDETLLNQ